MYRSRGYCFTVNNWTDADLGDVIELCENKLTTYLVIGFEIGEMDTPHLQGYVHFSNPRTLSCLKKVMPRAHFEMARASGDSYSSRWEYCMKDGDYWEFGNPPKDGVNTTSNDVIESIKSGKSYRDLCNEYPSYMIHHGRKVRQFIEDNKPRYETKFYVYTQVVDAITELHEYFDFEPGRKVAVVTELDQLEAYESYTDVIYIPEYYQKVHSLWTRGVPISYKYGYETRVVQCMKFIVVTDLRSKYSGYEKIR